MVCAFTEGGTWKLGRLDPARDDLVEIAQPYTDIAHVRVAGGRVFFRGGSPDRATEVVALDLADGTIERLLPPVPAPVAPSGLSRPEAIRFPTSGGEHAHGFFYPPKNADFEGEAGRRPPLIVVGHGGPTAAASTALDPKIQFWTSRGFAVLDVNYRGSTGFGRAYRDALKGRWGVTDVDDCVAGARHLVDRGLVDGTRLAIRGSSAGGFTVLCAVTFHDVFRAAACYYGISDLEALARDTHKFEAHYTDTLVGPYPEQIDLYRARSPIHHVGRLSCPLIVLQGLRDKVVPPSQAEAIVDAVRAKGLPVAYVTFADEGHGFRNADNGRRALEAELAFYAEVFGFVPADELPGLAIENA